MGQAVLATQQLPSSVKLMLASRFCPAGQVEGHAVLAIQQVPSSVKLMFVSRCCPAGQVAGQAVLATQQLPSSVKLMFASRFCPSGQVAGQAVLPVSHVLHAPQVPPLQSAVHVLVCVPPLPQDWLVGCVCVGLVQVPVQEPVSHVPLLQVTLLVCVPHPLAQACVAAGCVAVQAWLEHVLHAPQVPPLQLGVHVLVCVPPAPQDWDVGWVCVGLVQVPVQEPVTQEPLLQVTLLV